MTEDEARKLLLPYTLEYGWPLDPVEVKQYGAWWILTSNCENDFKSCLLLVDSKGLVRNRGVRTGIVPHYDEQRTLSQLIETILTGIGITLLSPVFCIGRMLSGTRQHQERAPVLWHAPLQPCRDIEEEP